jgi:hypothetical protein
MSILGFFLAQLSALLAGGLLLIVLQSRELPPVLFGVTAWLAGTGALAAEHLLLAQAGLPWHPLLLALPWVALGGLIGWRWYRTRRAGPAGAGAGPPWRRRAAGLVVDLGAGLAVGAWTAALWWKATNQPLVGWDAIAMWLFKGRVFYLAGTVPTGFLTDAHYAGYAHLDYPLLVPLTVAQTYAWAGEGDMLMKGWWALLAGAAAAGLYWGLAGFAGRLARVAGLALVLTLPGLYTHAADYFAGYADLPLAVLFFFGALFLYRWIKQPTPGAFNLAVLFFCLAAFTKNEGLVVLAGGAVILGGLLVAGHPLPRRNLALGLLLIGGIVLPWQIERRVLGISGDLNPTLDALIGLAGTRLGPIWDRLSAEVRNMNNLLLLWPFAPLLGLGGLLVAPRRWLRTVPVLSLVGVYALGVVAAYLTTPHDLTWHLNTSADRVVFQPALVVILLATIYLGLLLDRRDPVG